MEEETARLKNLLQKVNKIALTEQLEQRERLKRGENFNVFNVLGLSSEEVRLHSAFVAELLNPNGKHGMGQAFLVAFLKEVNIPTEFINPQKVNVPLVERSIGNKTDTDGGRIDIVIEDGNHAVIIENKIYASDQDNQLLRYFNYGIREFKEKGNFVLLYLTLDGHKASNYSTGGNDNVEYFSISYKDDIINWLHECVKIACDKPYIRESIKQYIDLLKQLTGKDMGTKYISELAEIEIENIDAVIKIIDTQSEVAAFLRNEYIFKPLKEMEGFGFEFWGPHQDIILRPSGWKTGSINVTPWDTRKIRIEIGIGHESAPIMKLDCFEYEPDKNNLWNPYGYSMLPAKYSNWILPDGYMAMKNGEIARWIKGKVNEIISEVNSKHIEL